MTPNNPSVVGAASPTTPRRGRPDIDLRGTIASPLMDQGARPMCVPFTLSQAHEAAFAGANGAPMAPEAVWWRCSALGQVDADGILLEHGAQAIAGTGQPFLADWPWNPYLGVGTEDPPSAAGQPPWHLAHLIPIPLAHDGAEGDIEDVLAVGFPIILVIEITPEFENADRYGTIEIPDIRISAGDFHAVLVVGIRTHSVRGRCLLIRNSWGQFWGAGGYGWLPMEYLIAYADEAAVIVA